MTLRQPGKDVLLAMTDLNALTDPNAGTELDIASASGQSSKTHPRWPRTTGLHSSRTLAHAQLVTTPATAWAPGPALPPAADARMCTTRPVRTSEARSRIAAHTRGIQGARDSSLRTPEARRGTTAHRWRALEMLSSTATTTTAEHDRMIATGA